MKRGNEKVVDRDVNTKALGIEFSHELWCQSALDDPAAWRSNPSLGRDPRG
ncbi:MAG: hypothetical protein AB7I30_02270 [Isosphaeraceae bacterium]